jgi:hypothetical protein
MKHQSMHPNDDYSKTTQKEKMEKIRCLLCLIKVQTRVLFSSFLKANVLKAPAVALCTFKSADSSNSTRGGIPPSIL